MSNSLTDRVTHAFSYQHSFNFYLALVCKNVTVYCGTDIINYKVYNFTWLEVTYAQNTEIFFLRN